MSLDISAVRKEKRTVPVEFGDETFDVTYLPNYVTPKFEEELASLGEAGDRQRFREMFCAVVEDWDVKTSAKGKKVPLTPEGINDVPYTVLRAVMETVVGDSQGNP